MSAQQSIIDQVNQLWEKAHTKWNDAAAEAFYRQYILKMRETAEQFEQDCGRLEELNEQFSKELAAIEVKMLR